MHPTPFSLEAVSHAHASHARGDDAGFGSISRLALPNQPNVGPEAKIIVVGALEFSRLNASTFTSKRCPLPNEKILLARRFNSVIAGPCCAPNGSRRSVTVVCCLSGVPPSGSAALKMLVR